MQKITNFAKSRNYLNILPLVLLILFAFSFFYQSDISFTQDLGRHLKLGEVIWQTKEVPKTNLFSYTQPDNPFVNHHWLFEVLLYLSSRFFGLEALLIPKTFVLLLCVFLTLRLARSTKSAALIPVSFIFMHLLRTRTDLRPELISFLLTTLTLYILNKYAKNGSNIIFFIPLISLIWVNSHIYFPVGIAIQVIFVCSFIYEKLVEKSKEKSISLKVNKSVLVLILSLLFTLVNPNLLVGALYPFTVLKNLGVTTAENQSIFTLQETGYKDANFLFYWLAGILILAAIMASLWQSRIKIKDYGLILLGLVLASQAVREFPFLFFISLPSVLENINLKKSTVWTHLLNVTVVVLISIEAFFYLSGYYSMLTYASHTPGLTLPENWKPAMDFVKKEDLPGPILNNFEVGNYIIYRSYPHYKVFVDGRPEAFSADFFEKIYNPTLNDEIHFEEAHKKYGFKTIVFPINDTNPRTTKFFNRIIRDNNWKVVYLDQYTIVIVETPIQQALNLSVINPTKLDMEKYQFKDQMSYTNLSTFLYNMGNFEQSKISNQKALELSPDNPAANYTMARILLRIPNTKLSDIDYYLSRGRNYVFW